MDQYDKWKHVVFTIHHAWYSAGDDRGPSVVLKALQHKLDEYISLPRTSMCSIVLATRQVPPAWPQDPWTFVLSSPLFIFVSTTTPSTLSNLKTMLVRQLRRMDVRASSLRYMGGFKAKACMDAEIGLYLTLASARINNGASEPSTATSTEVVGRSTEVVDSSTSEVVDSHVADRVDAATSLLSLCGAPLTRHPIDARRGRG